MRRTIIYNAIVESDYVGRVEIESWVSWVLGSLFLLGNELMRVY